MDGERISVIKIRDMLMVSLPPDPDDATISALQNKTLQALERHQSSSLVLDLSAVETAPPLSIQFSRILEASCERPTSSSHRAGRFAEAKFPLAS